MSIGCWDLDGDVALLLQVSIHEVSPGRVSRYGPGPKDLQLLGRPASTEHKTASACRKLVPRQCQRDARHRARPNDRVGSVSGYRANAECTQYWPCWGAETYRGQGPVAASEQEKQVGSPVS